MKFETTASSEMKYAFNICEANISQQSYFTMRQHYFTRCKAYFVEKNTSEEVFFPTLIDEIDVIPNYLQIRYHFNITH